MLAPVPFARRFVQRLCFCLGSAGSLLMAADTKSATTAADFSWLWTGYYHDSSTTLVALENPSKHLVSGWVALGTQLSTGERLDSISDQRLTLIKGTQSYSLPLQGKESASLPVTAAPPPVVITKGHLACIVHGKTIEFDACTLRSDDFTDFVLSPTETFRLKCSRTPEGKYLFQSEFVTSQNGKVLRESSPGMVALSGQNFDMIMSDRAFSFQPQP